jgi:PAS domain-containing protein
MSEEQERPGTADPRAGPHPVGGRQPASSAIRDITDRKRAEEKFRGLLEAAPDAMVIVNPKGEIVLVNAQPERLFGRTREELLRKSVEMLVPPQFLGKHTEHRKDCLIGPRVRAMDTGMDNA